MAAQTERTIKDHFHESFSEPETGFASAYDPRIVKQYIAQAAEARGIDPNIAIQVARNEGLYGYVGDQGSSFGPFQLHYGNVASGGNRVGGLGDVFTQRTGLNARDPRTWQQQVDFSLDEAAKSGWGAWHGWKGAERAGLPGEPRSVTPSYYSQAPANQYASASVMNDAGPQGFRPSPAPNMFSPTPIAQQPLAPIEMAPLPQTQVPVTQAPVRTAAAPVAQKELTFRDMLEGKEPSAPSAAPASQSYKPVGIESTSAPQAPPNWGFAQSVGRGMLPGIFEPIAARGSVLLHGTHGMGYDEAVAKAQENMAKERMQYQQYAPIRSMAGEVLGAATGLPMAETLGATKAAGYLGGLVAREAPALAPAIRATGEFLGGRGGIASKAAQGATQGALQAAFTQPLLPEEDRGVNSVLHGAAGGAVVGGALGPAVGAATKSFMADITPQVRQIALNARDKFGINLRPSQVAANAAVKDLDAQIVPHHYNDTQILKWNEALAKEVGMPGETLTHTNVQDRMRTVGQKLDDIADTSTWSTTRTTFQNLGDIRRRVDAVTIDGDPIRLKVDGILNKLFNEVQPTMVGKTAYYEMPGQKFRAFTKKGGTIDNALKDNPDLAYQVKKEFFDAFGISNPTKAAEYNAARADYVKLKAVEPLAARSPSGVINPQSLLNVDPKRMTGDLRELAEIGKYLRPATSTGEAKAAPKISIKKHIGELVAGVGPIASAVAGYPIPFGHMAPFAAGAHFGGNLLRQKALTSPWMQRQVLEGRTFIPQAGEIGQNVLTGAAGGAFAGAGGMERRK